MGTKITVILWHEDSGTAKAAIASVMAEMRRIDETYSPWIESSELYRLNQLAAKEPQPVSQEMLLLLDNAKRFSELSEGAFDITFASVGHLYDYRKNQQPSTEEREKKLPAVNYHNVVLNKNSVSFSHENVVIDLGGIAKGYAADRAIEIMQSMGIQHGSVSAGGDSRLLGDRRGRPWVVGIKNPRNINDIAISLPLVDVAVSTSGDYERYFIDPKSGERIHHILNPRSGTSAKGIASVTIIGNSGIDTDPLSTSVFVLGVTKGLALINDLQDIDAIIIDSKGKVHYSQGLSAPSR